MIWLKCSMIQTIKMQNIFDAHDLMIRSRASELLSYINADANEVSIDFDGINFISRSFADELCNIIDDNKDKKFSFVGQIEEVRTMILMVQEGRRQERKRGIAHAKMYEFSNMEKLSSYLMNM